MFATLLLAAALALPASFVPPAGWTPKTPPPETGIDIMYMSPKYGVGGNGENFFVQSQTMAAGDTLDSYVRKVSDQLSTDHNVVDSHVQSTCGGAQPGWTFDARLPLPDGRMISQLYQMTVLDGRFYAFVFTHVAGAAIPEEITKSLETVCPTPAAPNPG